MGFFLLLSLDDGLLGLVGRKAQLLYDCIYAGFYPAIIVRGVLLEVWKDILSDDEP